MYEWPNEKVNRNRGRRKGSEDIVCLQRQRQRQQQQQEQERERYGNGSNSSSSSTIKTNLSFTLMLRLAKHRFVIYYIFECTATLTNVTPKTL